MTIKWFRHTITCEPLWRQAGKKVLLICSKSLCHISIILCPPLEQLYYHSKSIVLVMETHHFTYFFRGFFSNKYIKRRFHLPIPVKTQYLLLSITSIYSWGKSFKRKVSIILLGWIICWILSHEIFYILNSVYFYTVSIIVGNS